VDALPAHRAGEPTWGSMVSVGPPYHPRGSSTLLPPTTLPLAPLLGQLTPAHSPPASPLSTLLLSTEIVAWL
jgi:hypothetical protein